MIALPAMGMAPSPGGLRTVAEESGWRRTGRYDEVMQLCHAFARNYPKQVSCVRFGTTPEGRPMMALVASGDGVFEPRPERPAVLIQGGIHAGEIDGKDAGFWALRELLEGRSGLDVLARVTVVFVPVFNIDGHERFGANHRPNQNGPLEMGWRTTAQNLNLNRDYVKADAPEMVAMLRLLGAWDPIVYMDLHVTDGADFQPDVAVLVEPGQGGAQALREAARSLAQAVGHTLSRRGHMPMTEFYPSFVKTDDPSSGFNVFATPPRFSTSYWAERNRLGVLVETHSWKDYATRVRATHDTILAVLEQAAQQAGAWRQMAMQGEQVSLVGKRVPLSFEAGKESRMIDFPGYAYRREPSPISGQLRLRYDRSRRETWHVPLYDRLAPALTVTAPRGYLVPVAEADRVREKLALHGVRFTVLRQSEPMDVETYRAAQVSHRKSSFEGRVPAVVRGQWAPAQREVSAGSLFVPVEQPLGRLVLQLFEPEAPDSLCSWGLFDSAFEQKEYMEDYVAEQVAEEMLARDPTLRKEFAQKLADDAEFARDPGRRLEFFYRRHPSWDERFNLYPIWRIPSDAPAGNAAGSK